jgi:AAA15 family ATPase/GTPase
MLKRIYIDNFRCLVNFELNVDPINLILGGNGSGKSTVFEVLRKIQAFVSGDSKLETIFKSTDCTRWQISSLQRFELEILGNGGSYKYELGIEQGDKCRVKYENLWFENQPLLKFKLGEVRLYRDDYSELSKYPFYSPQSILSSLNARNDNTKLSWFKERMQRFIIVRILPSLMIDETSQEEINLTDNMENYASWYRYLSEDQSNIIEVGNALKEVLDGFSTFTFKQVTEKNKVLMLKFTGSNENKKFIEYRLSELSDGQRTLIALYTMLSGTKNKDYTLCIDEPENFLALPEIQHWLIQLYDLCSDGELQSLLISHHPELINYLLASPIGYWFDRQSNAPVRVKKIGSETGNNSGLPISELIARGWLNESV